MSYLEKMKKKMMVKPDTSQREKKTVVINIGDFTKHSNKDELEKNTLTENLLTLTKNLSDIEVAEGIIPFSINDKDINEKKIKPLNTTTIITDLTKKGFDRKHFLERLQSNKLNKVDKLITHETEEPDTMKKQTEKITKRGKTQKIGTKLPLIIEDNEDEEYEEKQEPKEVEKDVIPIEIPKKRVRKTKKVEKGVAILKGEVIANIGDTLITERIPKKRSPIIIKAPSYIMNNREIFVNFINALFQPYKKELELNTENISCDTIGKTTKNFELLTHQKIVRDYMNIYTPYRGLLLYHGLGSGKTCTSIAIAEGMKDTKNVIVMTPASLRANYIEELKKCGDTLYKRNQFWEWVSTDKYPDTLQPMSALLNLPQEFIHKNGGAFFINVKKPSNYETLSDSSKLILEEQLNEMIKQKYNFINYNGLRDKKLKEMSENYTKNIFDNTVVIIDEAHNFISRIVNKLKREKPIKETQRGEKEHMPLHLATKLYDMLLSAKNARVVLLSGTPVINYPNEFGILFNILRGYIKTWRIPLNIKTTKKNDVNNLRELLLGEKTMDYLDYSPSSKMLTITRNPFGFKNKIKKEYGYQGVSNTNKTKTGEIVINTEFISDDEYEKRIISILRKNDIDVIASGIHIKYNKALPDSFDGFVARYINESTRNLKNEDILKRRIIGLSSYFKSAQESLLPKFDKKLGEDYHVINIPMSDFQFKLYESIRKEERKMEKKSKPKNVVAEDYEDKSSTYRIFSRLACNFAIPDRPIPIKKSKKEEVNAEDMTDIIKEGKKVETKQDIGDGREGEIEGDEILDEIGGTTYKERLNAKIEEMTEHSNEYFTPEELEKYSPKFLHMLENIQDPEYTGLHLVYSQFRTAEGIGLFTHVLDKNGFTQFKIKKNNLGIWEINIDEVDEGKPTYALYTGTETAEEKEIIRKIYNGEWESIPDSIANELKKKYKNNNMGEVIKVFMITSSGSEGINLKNTRFVHLMDPYWHPVRSEQVIGRARRICSHKDLPRELQTVEVFVYIMIFSDAQLKSDEAIELKKHDLSKSLPKVPITSDQYLFEISELKSKLTGQLTEAIKESAFDCHIYSNGKCVNFQDVTIDKFTYEPDYA